ncbi:hypothetical protein MNBD_NITROSPINAE04-155, partial [hydrothermal vent metagenome]
AVNLYGALVHVSMVLSTFTQASCVQ